MNSASISGDGNTTVQVCGDRNSVNIYRRPGVNLWRPPKREPSHEREVLLSHFEAIPFTPRPEMDLVARWLAAEDKISVLTFTGDGGAGKTRLAVELFRRYESDWSVGFITSFHEPNSLAAMLAASPAPPSAEKPLLAVVDYAATRAEPLLQFLQDLAQYGTRLPKLRLLLLERAADQQSGWYERLFDYSQTSYTAGLFYQPEPIRLAPVAVASRREILEQTLDVSAKFHPNTARPSDGIDSVLLDRPDFGDPLVVMMAALASWDKGIYGALNLSRPDLAVEMARREKNRLEKRSKSPLLPHLAAHSTLCDSFDPVALLRTATEECDALKRTYDGGPGQLATDLSELLPSSTPYSSGAILPDIVGEAFVLIVKPDGISRAAHRHGEAVASTLVRALQDFHDPFMVRGENRSGVDGSLAVTWIRQLATEARESDLGLMLALVSAMPETTLELSELVVNLHDALLSLLPVGEFASPSQTTTRAQLLAAQAVNLSQLGRRGDALEAAAESVRLWGLLDRNSRSFVGALTNYAIALSDVGRVEEALGAACEAADRWRSLAERSAAFRPQLAMSLDNYANMLRQAGRPDDALATAGEGVQIRRQLAEAMPDAFLPDLARSLNNYANKLGDVGSTGAALEAMRESLQLRRQLASVRPDAYLPDFSTSLANYANTLHGAGRNEEARQAATESVQLWRRLSAAQPGAFSSDLGRSLAVLGVVTTEPAAAAALFREALETLLPSALEYPRAFASLTTQLAGDYCTACNKAGTPLDMEFLMQIAPVCQLQSREQ